MGLICGNKIELCMSNSDTREIAVDRERSVGVVLGLLGLELEWFCLSCSSLYAKSTVSTLVASLSAQPSGLIGSDEATPG